MQSKIFKVTGKGPYNGRVGVYLNGLNLDLGSNEHIMGFADGQLVLVHSKDYQLEEITNLDEVFNENAQLSIKTYQEELINNFKIVDRLAEERKEILKGLAKYLKKLQ